MATPHPCPLVAGPCAICAYDINLMGGSKGELQDLTNRFVYRTRAYGMESAHTNKEQAHDQQHYHEWPEVEEVSRVRYQGATPCKDGTCSAEWNCTRIASAMTAMARLNRIWQSNTISFTSKFRLYMSLATAILYGCETWTLLVDWRKEPGIWSKRLRKLLCIFYLEYATNDWVWNKMNFFQQLSSDWNLHGLSMSHVSTASPKPPIRAP